MDALPVNSRAAFGATGSVRQAAAAYCLTAVLALAACATSPRVTSDYDKSAEFSGLRTFALLVRPHPSTHTSPLVEQRTYDAIREELTSKGFASVRDPGQADFVVDFSIGAEDRLYVRSHSRMSPPGPGSWDMWGDDIDVHQYQEGTLAIDIFDARSRRAVWHGSAKKRLSRSDVEQSETPIREAVSAVLTNFPPK